MSEEVWQVWVGRSSACASACGCVCLCVWVCVNACLGDHGCFSGGISACPSNPAFPHHLGLETWVHAHPWSSRLCCSPSVTHSHPPKLVWAPQS